MSKADAVLVVGFGLHGQAVAAALAARNLASVVVDDKPSASALEFAASHGIEIVQAPSVDELDGLAQQCRRFCPTPGLPETHPAFAVAAKHGLETVGDFDLAGEWDDRPMVAITGTNGKTTVTKLVTSMLLASGVNAVEAGNTDVALVTAIDDPAVDVFVVEASSFRLGHSSAFRPAVGVWLNFDPDHLDVHKTLQDYEDAKASIWAHQHTTDVAIANAEDAVVMSHVGSTAGKVITFGLAEGDNHLNDETLMVNGQALLPAADLVRALPHDISNALAAATAALAGGASVEGVRQALREFAGLPHRVELVGEAGQVRWYDDSKATTPHAVVAAAGGFPSVILIAGGKNKGIDLGTIAVANDHIRAVVAIGDAAAEIVAVFDGHKPVVVADSMQAAVLAADGLAEPGDAVLLSPGCASYDWYSNYGERGDDFARLVRSTILEGAS